MDRNLGYGYNRVFILYNSDNVVLTFDSIVSAKRPKHKLALLYMNSSTTPTVIYDIARSRNIVLTP
jgi:hypothetical protein